MMLPIPLRAVYKKTALLVGLLAIYNPTVRAQTAIDAGLWATLNVEWGINSKFTLVFTEEMRLRENYTRLNLFYSNIGLEYDLLKNVKTAFIYRSIQKYTDGSTFSFRHRLLWDIVLKKKIGDFNLSYRHRLQAQVQNFYSQELGPLPEWFSRNKFQLKYDTDKALKPYASVELRVQISDPRNPQLNNLPHNVRCQVGMDYTFNLRHSMGIYYLLQKGFTSEDPEDLYILGLEYTIRF